MRRLRGDGRAAPTASAAGGRRSTPAWCRPPRSTGRRSSPPRASARPRTCTRSSRAGVRGGSQCGYCTPGFVCSMAAEYYRPDRSAAADRSDERPDGFDLHAISGNLCRCTGYRPIRDAARALGAPARRGPAGRAGSRARRRPRRTAPGVDGFARPADLAEALALLAEHPDATVVAGSTDWGVEANLRGRRASHVVAVDRLPELRGARRPASAVEIGAALTLSEVERALGGAVPLLAEVWPHFASRLIRNGATHRRQPRHRVADRRPGARPARPGRDVVLASARRRPRGRRWPTSSPATARPCCAPAS